MKSSWRRDGELDGPQKASETELTLIWVSFTSVGRLDTMIFSDDWGAGAAFVPFAAAARARVLGAVAALRKT